MKNFLKRAAALGLACLMTATTALASEALGDRLYGYTFDICDGTTLTRQVMWSASKSDKRTENFVTYSPNPSVSPKVSYGSTVLSKQTVNTMAKELEAQGDRVLSGINGDYFVMASGTPLGLVVTDGVLRSSDASHAAVGFRSDGTAVAGKPALKMRANFKGNSLAITGVNKTRTAGAYYLFTEDFGPNTKNTKDGYDAILVPNGEPGQEVIAADGTTPLITALQPGIGRRVPCTVEQVIDASGATAIPPGKFVLSVSDGGSPWFIEMINTLQPGDQVDIEISSEDTRWNEVDCAVGSLYHILSAGQVTEDQESGSTAAPRTAVGVKDDGSVVFYTIDGRQAGYSVGATSKMVAMRLAELGCTEGMLMDGGGSTTFVSTYPDRNNYSVMNKPSDGNQRAVTNAVFLVSNLEPTGTAGSLYITTRELYLLGGASTQCGATALDTGWRPMSALPGAVSWSADGGSVSSSGLFTAPKQSGVYTVTAESGGVTGSTQVTVYDTPDAIRLTNATTGKTISSLSLTPGQTVDINATATYRTLTLPSDDTCFTWTTNAGTVSKTGVLTAGAYSVSGKLTIQAGSHVASIPVTVTAQPRFRMLADFEDTGDQAEDLYFTDGTGAKSDWTFSDEARYGFRSCRWAYDPSDGAASITLNEPAALTDTDRYLALWVYGDNSGNALTALFPLEDGSLAARTWNLDFSGWRRLVFTPPDAAMSFLGFQVKGESAGAVLLDQVVLTNQNTEETTPPSVSMSLSGRSLTAKVSDASTSVFSPRQVSVAMDGQPVPFTFSAGTVTATLPALGTDAHEVTVTVSDACGNLARASRLLSGSSPCPFADMGNHWAAAYVGRLCQLGIVSGTTDGSRPRFSPNSPVTRGDFALMAARWLGLDLKQYENAPLPFTDAASIPSWDKAAVAALNSLNIMQGAGGDDGNVYANARASLTRAEAFTLLSRMQAKGWPEASLGPFSDRSSVPSWAWSATAKLVGQGIVSGSDGGKLLPNSPVSRAEVCKLLMTMW